MYYTYFVYILTFAHKSHGTAWGDIICGPHQPNGIGPARGADRTESNRLKNSQHFIIFSFPYSDPMSSATAYRTAGWCFFRRSPLSLHHRHRICHAGHRLAPNRNQYDVIYLMDSWIWWTYFLRSGPIRWLDTCNFRHIPITPPGSNVIFTQFGHLQGKFAFICAIFSITRSQRILIFFPWPFHMVNGIALAFHLLRPIRPCWNG